MPAHALLPSILALRAHVPENAFTAAGLGTLREGSGVVIGDSGLVLTIGYLITEAEEVWLTTQDGRVVAGHALAYDQETGFGLVQALGRLDLPALELGNSAAAKVGDAAIFADGVGNSVRARIVARQEFAGYWEYLIDDAIFIAPAHPSWGGAGLIDSDGKLIGIGSLRLQMMQDSEVADINMAVPIDLLKPILDDLLTQGRANRPPRPWLGVFAAESDGQVVVMSVAATGPAQKAGLRRGDIIADIRDGEIDSLGSFYRQLWTTGPVGEEVPMRVVRDGRDVWVRVKTADRNSFLLKPQLQ
jgi:S1-C subfamily serine protease